MPETGTITINHCIIALEKVLPELRTEYQKQVIKKHMTPQTRDSRLMVMETLLRLCYRAANDPGSDVLKELKQLPKQ